MKYIKFAFLVALFNFILAGGVVLALGSFSKPDKPIKTDPFAVIFKNPIPTNKTEVNVPTKTVVNKIVPTIDNRCIIIVDGQRYNVSVYRNQHSGGDIFQCGTDMSAIFHGQHSNSFLQKIQRYKI